MENARELSIRINHVMIPTLSAIFKTDENY